MRHFAAVALLATLAACGSKQSSGDTTPDELAGAGSASNETFAQLISAGGVPERCINLGSHYGENASQERALAGFLEFNTNPYVNPAPPFITAMVEQGILKHEGVATQQGGAEVNAFRPTAGNENMFRWFATDGARGGSVHLCPGTLSVEVVSYTEPAEERGMTQVQYRYRITDIPAPVRTMMDSGLIPAGPVGDSSIRGSAKFEGEGTATLVKTNNGWELN